MTTPRQRQADRLEREGKLIRPKLGNLCLVGTLKQGDRFRIGWDLYRIRNTGAHIIAVKANAKTGGLVERCLFLDPAREVEFVPPGGF